MTDTLTSVEAPVGAVSTIAVVDAQASVTAPLQAIVEQADTASADLRAQRDALLAQRADLNAQIATLNAQIATVEGPGAAMARNALIAIQQAMSPPPVQLNPRDRFNRALNPMTPSLPLGAPTVPK